MMAAVSKSTVPARREAANEIIQAARKGSRHGSENSNLFSQFASLVDHLIRLCFHPGQPKSRSINISTEFSSLKRMMPLGIILPVQQSLTVALPSYDVDSEDQPKFNVFSASEHVTIAGIADEAEILSSLQKPKKVNLYIFFYHLFSRLSKQLFFCTFFYLILNNNSYKIDLPRSLPWASIIPLIGHVRQTRSQSQKRKLNSSSIES